MSILVYALHYDGEFNKNSLGAVSEGARLASELGGQCHAIVVGDKAGLPDDMLASLGSYGATKAFRVEGPEGLAQPVVDAMAKVAKDNGHKYLLFGGGLLGFEIGAGLAARLDAGVCMEVTEVKVVDAFPDLRVKPLAAIPHSCGPCQMFDAFPPFPRMYVDAFSDFDILRVDAFRGRP